MRIEPPSWGYNEIQYHQQYHMEIVSLVGGYTRQMICHGMAWQIRLHHQFIWDCLFFQTTLISPLFWHGLSTMSSPFQLDISPATEVPIFFWDVHHQNVGKIDREIQWFQRNNIHMKDVALDFLCPCYWSRLEVVKKTLKCDEA